MMNQKSLTENEALSTVVDMLISATETVNLSNIESLWNLIEYMEMMRFLVL